MDHFAGESTEVLDPPSTGEAKPLIFRRQRVIMKVSGCWITLLASRHVFEIHPNRRAKTVEFPKENCDHEGLIRVEHFAGELTYVLDPTPIGQPKPTIC